jgi:hypothetical protein
MIKIFVMLISLSAFSSEDSFYQIGTQLVIFKSVEGILVNGQCEDRKCAAYKAGINYKNAESHKDGKNPVALKCKSLMKGKVIIATDLKGNEQTICAFEDGSYLI